MELSENISLLPESSEVFFLNFFLMFTFFIFERESVSRGGAEGEGERIPSRLSAITTGPDVGLELTKP